MSFKFFRRIELAIFGYIRQYFRCIDDVLPPNDIILLFVSWISFLDSFLQSQSHNDIDFDPDNDRRCKRDIDTGDIFASTVGKILWKRV